MKRILTLLGTGLLAVAATSASAAGIVGNVNVTTDYIWRGVSQTNHAPAIQGGYDYSNAAGVYLGFWASSVRWEPGSLETDWYGGYNGKITNDLGYSVGYIYYYYPKQGPGPNDSFGEVNGNLSYKDFSAGFAYSNNYSGDTGRETYYQVGYSPSLPGGFGLAFHAGRSEYASGSGLTNYNDYSVTLSKTYAKLNFALAWTDTSMSQIACGGDNCKSRVTFSIGKSL